jgi:hypothetical protein
MNLLYRRWLLKALLYLRELGDYSADIQFHQQTAWCCNNLIAHMVTVGPILRAQRFP